MKFVSLLSLLFLSFAGCVFAQQTEPTPRVIIDAEVGHVRVNDHAQLLRTHTRIQLSQVQALPGWSQQTDTIPLEKDQALWQRFSIVHQNNISQKLLLIVGNPSINYLDAYVLDDKNRILQTYLVGAKRHLDSRPYSHRNFVLPISMSANQTMTVYLRIQDDGPTVFPVNLWTDTALVTEEQFHLASIGVIGGALAILFFYFLVTYVLLRSPIRFWFSVANAGLLLLFLNIQGIVSQFTALGAYTSELNSVTVAIVIFAAAKVCHAMLERVPIFWRFISYLMALSLIAITPILNSYWQIVVGASLTAAAVLLHLLLALIYHNRKYSKANGLYTLGWLVISATVMFEVSLYLSGKVLDTNNDLLMSLIVMGGVLLLAVAIESHEKAVNFTKHLQQQNTIENLHQFYDLFRNSAEGLYTSTQGGKLVTTNPAMCQLFGYSDESQMLSEVKDTSVLYADPHQRDLLMEEVLQHGMALGKEIKGIRRDGSEFWFCISVQLTGNGEQKTFYGSIFDISEKKQSTINLEYLTTHDSLTGVYNRREFEQKLRDGIRRSKQLKQELTLLYVDLDQFKVVNDSCGHKAGDALIKQLSGLLNDAVINKGILARLGGDEFGVILESENAEAAAAIANQLLSTVREFRFIWDNRIFTLSASIGMAKWHESIESPEQLMSMADAACYVAKEQGRNQVHLYSNQDTKMQRYETELQWVSQINLALEQNKFVLYYQHYYPLSKVADGHHYEILLRMLDEDGQILLPAAFLPVAERYNLTIEIDKWVIENTLKWLSEHPEHLAQLRQCNINLSGQSLADNDLKRHVMAVFETYKVPYSKICFEITESMAIVKMEETLRFISAFKKLGCTFALDDFGSGFSSYSYLKSLPVDCLKIDGSFVKDLLVDPVDMAMVCSMKDVAKAMAMTTVAEFVESKDVMVELGKIGVDFAQGFGVAKPAPLNNFEASKTID